MKRIVTSLLVVALLSCCLTTAFAEIVRVTGGSTNIRRTPTLNGDIIDQASEGEEFEFWGSTSTDDRGVVWYNIIYGNISAWISSKYSILIGASGGSSSSYSGNSSSSGSSSSSGTVRATGDANIRKGPGLDYGVITSVNAGTSLTYLGEFSTDSRGVDWYKIRTGNTTGWISSKYASLQSSGSASQSGKTSYSADLEDYYWETIQTAAKQYGCQYAYNMYGEDGIGAVYEGQGITLFESYGQGRVGLISLSAPSNHSIMGLRIGASRSEVKKALAGVEYTGYDDYVVYIIRGTIEEPLILLGVTYNDNGNVDMLEYGLFS